MSQHCRTLANVEQSAPCVLRMALLVLCCTGAGTAACNTSTGTRQDWCMVVYVTLTVTPTWGHRHPTSPLQHGVHSSYMGAGGALVTPTPRDQTYNHQVHPCCRLEQVLVGRCSTIPPSLSCSYQQLGTCRPCHGRANIHSQKRLLLQHRRQNPVTAVVQATNTYTMYHPRVTLHPTGETTPAQTT